MSAVATAGSVVLALLVLLYLVAALYGQHLARLRWERHYSRAEVRADKRRMTLAELEYERRYQQRRAEEEQRLRHADKRRAIHKWERAFYDLQREARR